MVESWCMDNMNKLMENEAEERSKIFDNLKGVVEANLENNDFNVCVRKFFVIYKDVKRIESKIH